jgi:BirA family biotin operon repressor/biotin-[acetyl-CoA-carboxylase] ligase
MARPAPPGFRVLVFEDIDSTNAEAARRAAQGEPEGLVIRARAQTAGRGRRGRSWVSPAGNCYSSILLRPEGAPRGAMTLGFVAALAASEAVRAAAGRGAAVQLKWPNDVLLDGKKIAGCLLESRLEGQRLAHLIVGVGINVASHPEGTEFPATDLHVAGAAAASADSVFFHYLEAFAHWHARWKADGFAPVRAAWLGLAVGLGQPIKVRLEAETLVGRFEALDSQGALILRMADGERLITTGDVFSIPA